MIKYSLLAGAMLIASPALAQQAPTSTPVAPQTAPVPTDNAPQSAPTQTATPQAAADKVAQVIESEFPTYDKDGNGALSKAEFGAWMATLRANDPAAKPGSAVLKKWVDQAFARTDSDQSKSLSKAELAIFLAKGQG